VFWSEVSPTFCHEDEGEGVHTLHHNLEDHNRLIYILSINRIIYIGARVISFCKFYLEKRV
jgi:hypothetical protein